MAQLILEFLAWIGLDYADYKHQKEIKKREREDGIKRPIQKYFLQPSIKIFFFLLLIACLSSFMFFIYQRNSIFPKKTKAEILEISLWVEKLYDKFGEFPKNLNEVIGNNPMRQNWFKDAWNREYLYSIKENGKVFLIVSAGKDGKFGTEDDISSK